LGGLFSPMRAHAAKRPAKAASPSIPKPKTAPNTLAPSAVALPKGQPPRAVLASLGEIAPEQAVFVAEVVGGKCRMIDGEDGGIPKPIATAFAIYVLGALSKSIDAGLVKSSDLVTMPDRSKRLPIGQVVNEANGPNDANAGNDANGNTIPIKDVAQRMMRNDLTAMDVVIARLGRDRVERALSSFSMTDPNRNIPLLTAKGWLQLKWGASRVSGDSYASLSSSAKRTAVVNAENENLPDDFAARLKLDEAVLVEEVNWFASMEDLCRLQTSLRQLSQRPLLASFKDVIGRPARGTPAVASDRFVSAQYISGMEPGVLVQSWLLQRIDGRVFSVNVMLGSIAPIDLAQTNATIGPLMDWLAAKR
jgi:hypothetical protein